MKNIRIDFESLLTSKIIRSDAPDDEYNSLIDPIIDFLKVNTPSSLFRYRSCNELNFDAFNKDEIWAVSSLMFNDPYDSYPYIDKETLFNTLKEQLSIESQTKIWDYVSRKNDLPKKYYDILGKKATKQLVDNIKKSSLDELRKQWESSSISDKDFRTVIDQKWNEIRTETRNANRIASFSENVNSVTMWAHYADYHKGFALEYDLKNGTGLICENCPNKKGCNRRTTANIYPVIYKQNQFDATYYVYDQFIQELMFRQGVDFAPILSDSMFFQKMYLQKHESWSYESEWRLLCCSNTMNKAKTASIAIKPPVAIYYGSKISPIHKKILHIFAQEKGIKEFQMRIDDKRNDYTLTHEKE